MRNWRRIRFAVLVAHRRFGKTVLAVMATAYLKRPAIYLVPTLDLLGQWVGVLEHFFQA